MLLKMGARKHVFFEEWLPNLRHKWPCENYLSMHVRGKSIHGSSRAFNNTYSFSDIRRAVEGSGHYVYSMMHLCIYDITYMHIYIYIYICTYMSDMPVYYDVYYICIMLGTTCITTPARLTSPD